MKPTIALALCGLFVASATRADNDPVVGQHVPAFAAQRMDLSTDPPATAAFESTQTKRVTAYMILGVGCPATQAYAERMSKLRQVYAPKEVDFVYVYSNREDTLDKKVAFHREHQLGGWLVDDQGGAIAKKLGARRTSELFVTDKEGTIVYHGAVDDSRDPGAVKQHYLQAALDQVLTGSPVTVASTPVSA